MSEKYSSASRPSFFIMFNLEGQNSHFQGSFEKTGVETFQFVARQNNIVQGKSPAAKLVQHCLR